MAKKSYDQSGTTFFCLDFEFYLPFYSVSIRFGFGRTENLEMKFMYMPENWQKARKMQKNIAIRGNLISRVKSSWKMREK